MAEGYVGKEEFNNLVKRVDKMEEKTEKIQDLMIKVDKKTDVILEKVANSNNFEDLKLQPVVKRIEDLEDNQRYVRRQLFSTIVTVIITLIGLIIALVKLTIG